MTSPAHPDTRRSVDLLIGARAGQAVQAYTAHHGQSARAAHAWIDTLHNRAHRAAERHRRWRTPRR